jgi:hypothetical protein
MLVGLESLFHLKSCMSSFMAFGSRQLSLVVRSRLSFVIIASLLCVGEDLPPYSDDADEDC